MAVILVTLKVTFMVLTRDSGGLAESLQPVSPPLLRLCKTAVSGARLLPGLQRGLAGTMRYILTCACAP